LKISQNSLQSRSRKDRNSLEKNQLLFKTY
jgi:hypothetical protein